MCRLFSGTVQIPAPELPNPALGPWVGKLGGLICPTAVGPSYLLPCNYTASISHSGSKGRSKAKGPPKPGIPHSQLLVFIGEGQEIPCILPPQSLPSDPHHVLSALQDRWDMETGIPPGFLECITRLGRVLMGLGQPMAVQAQPGRLYSHSSVPASVAVPCCSYAPCRTQQCGAKPRLFLHPFSPAPALPFPVGKADSSPGSHWDPCSGLGLRPGQLQAGLFAAQD